MRLIHELSQAQRVVFVTAARSFMGARWAHQGRRPDRMDCIGLVVLSLKAAGIQLRDRTDYGKTPHNRKLRAELLEHFGEPVDDLRAADIVTMTWAGEEHHVAIVTDHPEGLGLIHCWSMAPGTPSGGGRVVEHRLDESGRAKIVETFRP